MEYTLIAVVMLIGSVRGTATAAWVNTCYAGSVAAMPGRDHDRRFIECSLKFQPLEACTGRGGIRRETIFGLEKHRDNPCLKDEDNILRDIERKKWETFDFS